MCYFCVVYCSCCKKLEGADMSCDLRFRPCHHLNCNWRRYYLIDSGDLCDHCDFHNHTEPCETRQRPSTVDQTFTINSSEDLFVEESSDSDSQLEDNEPDQVELP
jgi:hypothetical protein